MVYQTKADGTWYYDFQMNRRRYKGHMRRLYHEKTGGSVRAQHPGEEQAGFRPEKREGPVRDLPRRSDRREENWFFDGF